jgi:hypothetical protein
LKSKDSDAFAARAIGPREYLTLFRQCRFLATSVRAQSEVSRMVNVYTCNAA